VSGVWVATEADVPKVAELLVEFRDWWGRGGPRTESYPKSVRRLLVDTNTDVLLAGAPDGVAVLRYRFVVWTESEECELEDLYIRDAARGRGLGRSLVSAAIEQARSRGCRRILVETNETNHPALALYRSHGFSSWLDPPGGNNLHLRRDL
jgi:ribosomal protein S18 acetylase RimI-like enzyme